MTSLPAPPPPDDHSPSTGHAHAHHHVDLHLHEIPPPHEQTLIHRFDDAVDRAFDRTTRGREPIDRILYGVTELGDFGLVWVLLAWARGLGGEEQARRAVQLTAVLAAESFIVNGALKNLFKRERPVYQGDRPHKLRIPLTTSFPSGHASSAMVSAIVLSDGARVPGLYYALAGVVAASRVHVKIHHASDVAGGLAVGTVLGLGARAVLRRLDRRR